MKNLTLFLFISLIFSCFYVQPDQPKEDWRADLRFLQKTVHDDYPFLLKKITAKDFDKAVNKLSEEIPNLETHEIITGMARLVSSIGYGHTSLPLSRGPLGFHRIPANFYHFKDGVFLEGVHKDYSKSLGAKVLKIEGLPIKEALKIIRPVVPAENDQYFKAFGINYLRMPEVLHAQGITKKLKKTVTLTLEKDGKQYQETFEAKKGLSFPLKYSLVQSNDEWLSVREKDETPLYLKNLDRIYFYEYMPKEKALYVRHSQIQDDPEEGIPAFYKRVFDFIENNEVEKLILDVRLNGGGNNYKIKPIIKGIVRSDKINQPGKFITIIGRRTFSACQNLINELDNYTNVLFVGEPSAENINFYGDTRKVTLPNSQLPVYLSFAWWQDKPQWENEDWMAPHLAVEMSFEEYRTNQDPVLTEALNFSGEGFLLDPMAHLTELFMANKVEELESTAFKMVKDPRYQFFNFEDQFNRAGYQIMGSNLEGALFVFELNTKLFPKSANAWDSFAEGNWKANHIKKAIEYYNKAITLDPNGKTGDNARNMLSAIEKEQMQKGH